MLNKSPNLTDVCVKPLAYTSAARIAFQAILEHLKLSHENKLLLPAYIGITDREGSGVFDPVLGTHTPHEFYGLNPDLSADKSELYEMISSGKYGALLVIHYFGFCLNDMGKIRQLCQDNDVVLIEDCAHAMWSEISEGVLGHLGDYSFYSLHKFLATEEGGCLQVNTEMNMHLLQSPTLDHPKRETLDILARSDLAIIRERRRANYQMLSNKIKDFSGIELMYPDLPEGISPHNLPLLVSGDKRESLYFKLIEAGVPAIALYYRLIDPISQGDFPDSTYISDHILNLPIHQDINGEDIEFMATTLRNCLS